MRALFQIPLALWLLLSCAPGGGGEAREASAAPQAPAAQASSRLPLGEIRLPAGFKIEVFSDQVPNSRQMALSPRGILYAGSRSEGKVYAVVDANKDGRADQVFTIARGLKMPSGLAFRDGALYVGDVSRVLRWDGIDDRLKNPPEPKVVSEAFPSDRHHGWKFIAFGPDGLLYVPVGAPCNICESEKPIYASITRIKVNPNGTASAPEIVARGVRNTVGFDWHPQTRELWFAENGRDMMGDNQPPDELNRVPRPGLHFGYPYCHGNAIPDPEFGKKRSCDQFVGPERSSDRMWRRSGCASTPGRCFRPSTATRSSLPSTARGTAASRSATASCSSA